MFLSRKVTSIYSTPLLRTRATSTLTGILCIVPRLALITQALLCCLTPPPLSSGTKFRAQTPRPRPRPRPAKPPVHSLSQTQTPSLQFSQFRLSSQTTTGTANPYIFGNYTSNISRVMLPRTPLLERTLFRRGDFGGVSVLM